MKSRQASEDEKRLFRSALNEARPVKAKTPVRRAPKSGAAQGGEPEARLDLHGLTQEVAHRALLSFLRGAQKRGLRQVLVITGKGAGQAPDTPFDMSPGARGVLKSAVPRWLNESVFAALIAGTAPAHRRHGGAGALYVRLRKK